MTKCTSNVTIIFMLINKILLKKESCIIAHLLKQEVNIQTHRAQIYIEWAIIFCNRKFCSDDRSVQLSQIE